MASWERLIPKIIHDRYELYNFNNAVEIMSRAYLQEYLELIDALENMNIKIEDITAAGGSESNIPKKFSEIMRPRGWEEVKITGDLLVKMHRRHSSSVEDILIKDYIDGHNIDYVKGKVAVDMEWNSKDQTFDRDLYAFRSFYECGIIDCGVIITRSEELNPLFSELGIKQKYGASTTWMGKLLPRIQARRHGGCPIFVAGITPRAISDWEK